MTKRENNKQDNKQNRGAGPVNFSTENDKAKLNGLAGVIKKIERIARHDRLSYDQFAYVCKAVRQQLNLKPDRKAKRLPVILSEGELTAFFTAIDKCGDITHQLMLRLLFFTGVRVGELVAIKMDDVYLGESKVFIREGKGAKDRYVLMPDKLVLALTAYMEARPGQVYLFESNRRRLYSTRRIEQVVKLYQERAGITKRIHPHLLRHQLLTFLTTSGLSDAQIQLISGHASKKSLEVYQHLSLDNVQDDYQAALKGVGV